MKKWIVLLALFAALLLSCALSLAETARVVTPGGKLNMRKTPEDKGRLVSYIPNHAMVEVLEVENGWARVSYRKKSGYIHADFLRLPSDLPGKTVYSDGETLILRRDASADARPVAAVSCLEPVTALRVDDDWVLVRHGDTVGYVETVLLSYQWESPVGDAAWIRESATVVSACDLRDGPGEDSRALAPMFLGQEVIVTVIDGERCLIQSELGCGYLPTACLCLKGPADADGDPEAASAASAALKKKYKPFARQSLYCNVDLQPDRDGIPGPVRCCGFYNEEGQYLYAALVNEAGKVVFTAAYPGFAAPVSTTQLLPHGQVELSLSAETLAVGEVLDITVATWTEHACRYTLMQDGAQIFSGKDTRHFRAACRPRRPGEYTLVVTVTDEDGFTASATASFRVTGTAVNAAEEIYSQKDGWWDDKPYRKSDLGKSGCAIFTLSHALHILGYEGEETQPERLARTYALCLTVDGTNNERLLNEASEAFGFITKRDLYENAAKIREALEGGALFSFSIARGHIALICGISGNMVRVIDSAPSATFERIVNTAIYVETKSGSFRAIRSLEDVPGARWYFETDSYGGLSYWMPLDYAARRGVRLIQPAGE